MSWKTLMDAQVDATDKNGTPRRTKKGDEWSGGFGFLEVNGTVVKVFIMVQKQGKTKSRVSISQSVDGPVTPPTS